MTSSANNSFAADQALLQPLSPFCVGSYILSLFLSVLFVGSLYLLPSFWRNRQAGRDHPLWLKERFLAALAVCIVSVISVWLYSAASAGTHFFASIGIRLESIVPAIVQPLALTALLFSGSVVQSVWETSIVSKGELHPIDYFATGFWLMPEYLRNFVWWRNYIVAPLSEEVVYRACLLRLLEPCIGSWPSIFVAPLFFGLAHFHHMLDRLQSGMSLLQCFGVTAFQVLYTSLFGAYSSFIFLRTRHLLSCVVVHSFCNLMGLPSLPNPSVFASRRSRAACYLVHVGGFFAWMWLLYPLTERQWIFAAWW